MLEQVNKTRVYVSNKPVQIFEDQQLAYSVWLALPKGVRAAFRGAGDATPVYAWDYVDRM